VSCGKKAPEETAGADSVPAAKTPSEDSLASEAEVIPAPSASPEADEPAEVIDGLTGDQRFFLAYAQSWRTKRREEATLRLLKADPHSPPLYRVNGVVRNIDEWYTAFNVSEEDDLYLSPEQRVSIW
jgi:predicted metalloendopeptidase